MPFIDLNNKKAATSGSDTGSTPPPNPPSATASVNPPENVEIDPRSGVREIKGPDLPVKNTVQQPEAVNQPAQQPQAVSQPSPEPNQPKVELQIKQPDVKRPEAVKQAVKEPEVPKQNTPAAEAAEALPELEMGINKPTEKPEAVPDVRQAPNQLEAVPAPVQAEESQPAEIEVNTNPSPQTSEDQTMKDVMDRNLPELELKKPESEKSDPITANLEAEINQLAEKKSQEEASLNSREYGLDDLLEQIMALGASDLHLTAGYRALARVDGKLQPIKSQIMTHEAIAKMIIPIAKQNANIDVENDKDMDFAYAMPNGKARFRVNAAYQRRTLMATLRLIPTTIYTPEQLRLPEIVKQFTKFKQGLVLVTGPTGSGKSTTLASMINSVNMTEPKHIITIEDPIEYTYPKGSALVDQRAVGIDTKTWPAALRSALRQDPDIVLVGEMRDVETMEAGLQVAETGHLVFSTLHTNTAAQTVDRVIDAFPENKQSQVRTQLSSTLMAVISQRLIPVAGGGRRVAVEILVVTAAVRNAIREGKVYQIDNIIQTGAEFGMITLEKSLSTLVREGMISTEVAQRYANKPEDLLSLLGRGG